MSYHYPHHVGRIVPAERAGMAQPAGRYPRIGADGAKKILSFRRAESHKARWGMNWREGAAVAGGLLMLLVTAWLIWAALAEAVLAAAGAA